MPNPHIVLCILYSVPAPCDTQCTAVLCWSSPAGVQVNPLIHLQTLDQTKNQQQEIMNSITVFKCYFTIFNIYHLCYVLNQFTYFFIYICKHIVYTVQVQEKCLCLHDSNTKLKNWFWWNYVMGFTFKVIICMGHFILTTGLHSGTNICCRSFTSCYGSDWQPLCKVWTSSLAITICLLHAYNLWHCASTRWVGAVNFLHAYTYKKLCFDVFSSYINNNNATKTTVKMVMVKLKKQSDFSTPPVG